MGEQVLTGYRRQLSLDRASVSKFKIARTVLGQLNEHGDGVLGARREVLGRVVEFESVSMLRPEDQLKAQGLQAGIRSVVNVKDSFTPMRQERDSGREERLQTSRRTGGRRHGSRLLIK
ncbi:hypothetical protein ACIA98_35200 [Streptomyces sp. NPDC051366]|uniref:hypothetical protein n=1 Tax=Streptomyces sp. NPDC051366 TaxID=3365652 RepID=UPI0037A8C4A9